MHWKVPLSDVSFGPEEYEAVKRVLDSGWISMGPETEQFELEFARYLGAKHAIAVSSGTAALHLALLALGIGLGDEVIVPSLTFVATANAILYVGATPVFADITSLDEWNVSPVDIEKKITPKTKAIMVMHYGGYPCRMDQITAIAAKYHLKVVEDAAHAPGASFQGKKLGTWGDVGCFSFFSNKNMTTAEGGMVVTANDDLAAQVKILRSHGMTTLTWDRHQGHSFSYDVVATGYNYRMDEIRAALGRVQLSKLDDNNARRREVAAKLRVLFDGLDGFSMPFAGDVQDSWSCHIFPVILESAQLRPQFMAALKEHGIQTSIHYPPVHRFSVYNTPRPIELPLTEEVSSREVTLPLFPGMKPEQMEEVVRGIRTSACH